MSLIKRLTASIAQDALLGYSDLILVAFSGGPDSTALLHVLHSQGYKVHAAHVHHGIRQESDEEALWVEQFCKSLGIPLTIGELDVTAERMRAGGGVQEVARRLRYEFLEAAADEVGASVIATAHTQDDQVETVLLNIIRGTGTSGLGGIPYQRGRIVRPMLDITRAEVQDYCAEHGLAPRHDSSNDSPKYARNEARLKLLPYLQERFNPDVREALLQLSQVASQESAYLDDLAREWLCGSKRIVISRLLALPLALQRRVLRVWLGSAFGAENFGFAEVERIRKGLSKPGTATLLKHLRACWSDTVLWIERVSEPAGEIDTQIGIEVPGEARFLNWQVKSEGSLPCGTVAAVRSWRPGDHIRLAIGTKKLQDLFVDSKVPRSERGSWPVLVDTITGEVLAVANLRVSVLAPELQFTAKSAG